MEILLLVMFGWLALGGGTIFFFRNRSPQAYRLGGMVWAAAVLIAVVASLAPRETAFNVVTGSLACVNASLLLVAIAGSVRLLSVLGIIATITAIVLVLIGAFSTVPAIAAASVISLGAALEASLRTRRARASITS